MDFGGKGTQEQLQGKRKGWSDTVQSKSHIHWEKRCEKHVGAAIQGGVLLQ